jgi:alpha-galactosidase
MMKKGQTMRVLMIAALLGLVVHSVQAADKPLKVFILAGQSNMEGHAEVGTFDYIGKDPLTAPLLKEMRNPDGTPRVCDQVWMSYLTGPYDGSANGEGLGKLTAGFGARGDQPTKDGGKIGPEFTFGIHMEKQLDQPILIIKTAWGGRSLNTEFRPPGAGPYQFNETQLEEMKKGGVDIEKAKEEKAKASGVFYRMMIEHVKKVLADPKRVCPEYDPKQGYEIAGFVWFQGFNDLVDGQTYPDRGQPDRFALYSDLLATFIRDVRKDLNAPKMPFVIGVLGVGGEKDQGTSRFRKAMAAPAAMPEFKGNVAAVETAPFWDEDMAAAEPRKAEYEQIVSTAHALKKDGAIDTTSKWEGFWKPIGKPLPGERNWRFKTVDATEQKDKLEKYDARRFRDITLPAGMENWYKPGFDDSQWTEGKAPIGKGVWAHSGITLDKYPSTWGDGEFLLMRTTFEVDDDDLNFKEYRMVILARQGFNLYLNGHKMNTYIWWFDQPCYRSIVLTQDQVKLLKKGKNVLAAYANDQYGPDAPEHYAALDLWIEGITRADREKLDLELEKVFSSKDRECLKGASNGGYHYMGSAKIFAQIGKAFAEAMMTMRKK